MSIVEKGQEIVERRKKEEQERLHYRTAENKKYTIERFYRDFYRHVLQGKYENGLYVAHDLPEVMNWQTTEPGDSHGASSWDCEGLHYEVEWKFMGRSGDLAYWDDGYWPNYYLVLPKWFGLRKKRVEVYGAEGVARALEENA